MSDVDESWAAIGEVFGRWARKKIYDMQNSEFAEAIGFGLTDDQLRLLAEVQAAERGALLDRHAMRTLSSFYLPPREL